MKFNTDNLPDYVRNQLRASVNPSNNMDRQIVKLLSEHGELDVNEILVGFWTVYERKVSRKTITTRLSELLREGKVKRIKRGYYGPGEQP